MTPDRPQRSLGSPLLIWLGVLLACAVVIARSSFVADLSAFMPRAPSERQQMLMDQFKDGIVARLILVGIEGGDAAERARQSRALAAALRRNPDFVGVQNGEAAVQALDRAYFFNNRYLLSPTVDRERFSTEGLRSAIGATLDGLSGNAGLLLKRLLPRDPTGETRALLNQFDSDEQPAMVDGVWASRDGRRALLLLQTRADGSDTDAQARAIAAIRQAYADAAPRQADTRLLMTGTSVFSVSSRDLIEGEVHRLAGASLILVVSLLLLIYRSARLLALSLLPVLTGAAVGVAAVSLGFGHVHGLTLAFGTTLIGEAVDYAIYLFIQRPEAHTGPGFWRTLWLGTFTSIAGFAVLLGSGFPGLAQLGLYSTTGLLAALLVTRHVLPRLAPAQLPVRDLPALGNSLQTLLQNAARLRPVLALLMVAVLLTLTLHSDRVWNRSLSALNPVSKAEQQLDQELRADMGASDMRYVAVLTAANGEQALQQAEQAARMLQRLVDQRIIAGYQSPARVLPSLATQQARQAALPPPEVLRPALERALRDLPLRRDRLDGFLADIEAARQRAPLTRADLAGTSSALLLDTLLVERAHDHLVLMPLRAIARDQTEATIDVDQVAAALAQGGSGDVKVIDLYVETSSLFDSYLREALLFSSLGCLAVLALLLLALRSISRTLRVALPLACAVLTVTALTLLSGTQLTILHLVGLLLVVAVGSNYALFFDSANKTGAAQQQRQTILSLVVANLTTVGSFGLLGLSSVPVLSIIGTTVGTGAFLALVYSAILARRPENTP